ncbi:MAG: 3-dehydroquinate synthase [Leptolinea sp.]|jgi:3-dehydroquinate synthase|nr:3-dehydroquinate synthase [Leptolinea sp.]
MTGFLFLYGMPGSGKSTVGKTLADNLNLPFYDLDREIEQSSGKSVWQIFADEGEDGFRRRETEALKHLIGQKSGIVSLGGGSLLAAENRTAVEAAGCVVVLDASLPVMQARLQADPQQRPLLAGELNTKLPTLLKDRSEHYRSFENHVDTGALETWEAAWQVQVLTGLFRVGRMGESGGLSCAYDVRTSTGGLAGIGQELAERGISGPFALVTDENIGPLYASRVMDSIRLSGEIIQTISIPAGEDHKTFQTVNRLWDFFLSNQLDRRSTVVALGGGVVSDLAGFAAATYLRGIRWVGLPTTLLAMADASLGGKTGADLPQGKNLIGAFHSPAFVLADPDVLATLPEREFRSGLAEIIKHGLIADPLLFNACRELAGLSMEDFRKKPLTEIIRRAMAVKIRVIEQDPFEQGSRAVLNAGHTIGHAIELESDYALSHGEAVSIGLAVEAEMAEELGIAHTGLAGELRTVLEGVGLPVDIPAGMDMEAVLAAVFRDKKRAGNGVRFALPVDIGEVRHGIHLTLDELRSNHAFHTSFTRS